MLPVVYEDWLAKHRERILSDMVTKPVHADDVLDYGLRLGWRAGQQSIQNPHDLLVFELDTEARRANVYYDDVERSAVFLLCFVEWRPRPLVTDACAGTIWLRRLSHALAFQLRGAAFQFCGEMAARHAVLPDGTQHKLAGRPARPVRDV